MDSIPVSSESQESGEPFPPEVQGLKTISIGYSLGARFHHQVLPRLLSGAADGPRRSRRDGHLRAAAARPGGQRDGRAVEGGCLSSGPLGSISEAQVILTSYFYIGRVLGCIDADLCK